MVLEHAPLPEDIIKLGAEGINELWRKAKLRAAGIKRAKTLVEAAQGSVGLSGGEAARLEIWFLINDYQTKTKQLARLDEFLAEEVMKVPHVEKLLAIKGVGLSTVIGRSQKTVQGRRKASRASARGAGEGCEGRCTSRPGR